MCLIRFTDQSTKFRSFYYHIADPIRFSKSLRFEIEHKGWISDDETESGKIEGHVEREDDIATVAFWYQTGQPKRYTRLPPLAQRILPNLDLVTEGNAMMPPARHSPGVVELQKGYDWTGNGQILFMPAAEHPVFEVELNIEKEEYRGLIVRLTHAMDYGIWRIFLDGKDVRQPEDYMAGQKIQDYDLYSKNLSVKDYYLGSFSLKPGKHALRFECVGRNPLSKGNYFGLDSVRLRERWLKKRKLLG